MKVEYSGCLLHPLYFFLPDIKVFVYRKVTISSNSFFVMMGTCASSAGKPVTSKRNGFSSDGLFRMVFKNPMGLGVCVSETNPA